MVRWIYTVDSNLFFHFSAVYQKTFFIINNNLYHISGFRGVGHPSPEACGTAGRERLQGCLNERQSQRGRSQEKDLREKDP